MQPTPIDISSLTLEQLKALAYDQVILLNQAQANINVLQAEIAKRAQAQAEIPPGIQPYRTQETASRLRHKKRDNGVQPEKETA